jgi:phage virion morphogenesis protein
MLEFSVGDNFNIELLLAGLSPAIDQAIETALDKSAAAILNRLRTTYLAESDPTGSPWVPSLAGKKRRARGGTGTLFDTGRLYRSIQLTKNEKGVRGIGTDVPYAGFHQFGKGNSHREFLTFTPAHEKLAFSIFESEVDRMLKAAI